MVPKLVRKPAVLLEDAEGSEILVDVFVPLFLEGRVCEDENMSGVTYG
jgi:hypothetical protein